MTRTEWCVIDWAYGRQELIESFDTYAAAWRCANECNRWAETVAGDHFHTVEPIEVQADY